MQNMTDITPIAALLGTTLQSFFHHCHIPMPIHLTHLGIKKYIFVMILFLEKQKRSTWDTNPGCRIEGKETNQLGV